MSSFDDPESADASAPDPARDGRANDHRATHDLAPRATTPRTSRPSGVRRLFPIAAGLGVLAAIGIVASSLGGATTYFYNVDDAIERQAEIGDRRIRLQGSIVDGSEDQSDTGVNFDLSYNSVVVPVRLTGDVPDLFGPSIPVVIEGRFDGETFVSDKALVKHDETYDEENKDRVTEAEQDAERTASESAPKP